MNSSKLPNLESLIESLKTNSEKDDISTAISQSLETFSSKPEVLSQIEKILLAEQNQSFFAVDHFQSTYKEKELFDYDVSKNTSELLGHIYPKYNFKNESIGTKIYDEQFVHKVVNQINDKGYYILENGLTENECDQIIESIKDKNFVLKKSAKLVNGFNKQNLLNIKGNTCWVEDQQDILRIPVIQNLIMNPNILSVAQEYLGAIPIHCQANCWWSINYADNRQSLSKNAQLYHQDKEFIKFIKVFIYLNDVDEKNGPHSYISGSHKNYKEHVPDDYTFSSRLSDEYLTNQYSKDEIISMTGKKGTIIIEDTSGFHKGVPVIEGYRLLAQLEYCSSMYFNAVPSFTLEGLGEDFKSFSKKYPRVFQNYNHTRYIANKEQRKKTRKKYKYNNMLENAVRTLVPRKIIKLLKN